MMEKVASLGVPMCKPISIELCYDEVHSLHEWIDGRDAIDSILAYSENQQYTYGVEAGKIQRYLERFIQFLLQKFVKIGKFFLI